jgi:ribosome-associated toxin RatA of RatAB toxin-antitoxin module
MDTAMRSLPKLAILALLAGLSAPIAAAAQSEPKISISHDEARDAMVIHASIDIEAPPSIVWSVVTDCNRAPKYVPNMESCRIVEREPHDRWQVRESVHNVMLLPRIRSVSRVEFDKDRRMSFKKAGGDMRIAEGDWRLEPLDKGKATRLSYNAVLALNISVPNFMVENVANQDVPTLMKNIERESLGDEEKKQ